MKDNRQILAVGAHPDDVEFLCAGALFLLKEKGYRIAIATLSAGDLGSQTEGPEAIMARRREEAKNAASLLDAPYFCLDERDFCIDFTDATRRKVTRLVREVNPFLVFTHSPQDYMADHEITSQLVQQACFAGPVPNYRTEGIPADLLSDGVPYVYYADAIGGTDILGREIPGDILVDITPVMEKKKEILACHASQREWLRVHHGMDQYINAMVEWAETRGREAGVRYAEAFRQHRGHGYPAEDFLRQCLSR
jgi:LmbE family N-acetylglucosaminyl deacetylase